MKERRTRKLTVRFTDKEYERLEDKFQNIATGEMSENVRNLLFNKPIIIKQRNASIDNFMEELISMRQELNAIGNNFNQVVKKLHMLEKIPEFRTWITINEETRQQLISKVKLIQTRIDQFSEKWLQE